MPEPHLSPSSVNAADRGFAAHSRQVLAAVHLPFTRLTTREHGPDGSQKYAVTVHGTTRHVETWCHPIGSDDGTTTGTWHLGEDEAWACFDRHHPGLRAAITYLEGCDLTAEDPTS